MLDEWDFDLNGFSILCEQISLAISEASQSAVRELREMHVGDELLGFALGVADGISGVAPYALTTAGLDERMSAFDYPSSEAVLFEFVEWRQGPHTDFFAGVNELCESARRLYERVSEHWRLGGLCVWLFADAVESGLVNCLSLIHI